MKNKPIKRLIPILMTTTVILLTSCFTDDDSAIKSPNEVISSRYIALCDQQVEMADVAFRLNEYINAPNEQKEAVEDLYFPNNKLRKRGNLWEILLSNIHVLTDGGALNRPRSFWKVCDTLTTDTIELRYIAENIYSLITRKSRTQAGITDTNYRIETLQKQAGTPIYLYKLAGDCSIISIEKLSQEKNQIQVNAQITQSLEFDKNRRIKFGEVELSVIEIYRNNTDHIRLRYISGNAESIYY